MKGSKLVIIALISVTLIALELVWTRIFSAEFFYTFAFLVLSLAIMGLGMGALALRLFSFLHRERYLGVTLSVTGLMSLLSPILVFQLGLRFSQLFNSWAMVGKLILTVFLLSSAFFFGGIAIAMLFRNYHREIPRLYMADLLGAGAGVLCAIILMNRLGTPAATFLIALPVLLAALLTSGRWLKVIPVALAAAVFILCPYAGTLLEVEREEHGPVIYKHWDAMAKIKLFDFSEHYRGINVDNVANSPVYRFDGNWDRPDSMKFEWGIDASYLIDQFDSCVFLSLGSGGGTDVLQALQEGATEIHAVEVNPHVNKMMLYGDPSGYVSDVPRAADATTQDSTAKHSTPEDSAAEDPVKVDSSQGNSTASVVTLAEYSGYIYHDPRVKVVTEDARIYVRRHKKKFDVIYSLASNTWAALASGSFALAESYLFTTEAFQDYWEALSDSGFMMMEHQFYMPRMVSEVMDALDELGVEDVRSHFAVYDLPQMRRNILLLSKRPLNDEILNHAFGELTAEKYEAIHLLYPVRDSLKDSLISQIVERGWEDAADLAAIDISPCTDNRPFIAQMGMWKNFHWNELEKVLPYEFFGFPLSQIIIVVILLVVILLAIPLNLVPYLTNGDHLRAVPWLYFFIIGAAFMAVEVVLIQKYTFFVGPSVYAIAAILLTLLIGSGIGSRFAKRTGDKTAFLAIITLLLLDVLAYRYIIHGLDGLEMFSRILITVLLIFPLGFFMGMPFPKGALRVGALIDWGFAVNGAASVLGATFILLVAITSGFTVALLLGAFLYLLAFAFISVKSAW